VGRHRRKEALASEEPVGGSDAGDASIRDGSVLATGADKATIGAFEPDVWPSRCEHESMLVGVDGVVSDK